MDVPPACGTSNAHQLRVVQQLLWNVIAEQLYPAERDEIRRALGESVLDENETLFAEAGALADIMGDVQLSTEKLLAQQQHQRSKDPQRELLQKVEGKIRQLIDQLHASAAVAPFAGSTARERDPVSLLPSAKGKVDKAVLEHVTTVAPLIESGRPHSSGLPPRPPTSSSRPGTSSRPPTSLSASAVFFGATASSASRPGTAGGPAALTAAGASRPSTASSAASSAATRYTEAGAVVAAVGAQLSVASIDTVRELLRGALADERAALMEDIEYLQGLLDAEADLHTRVKKEPPSITNLTDYKERLEAVVIEEEARVAHELRVSAIFAAAEQEAGKAGRLRGMVDASRRPPSAGGDGGAAGALSLGAAGAGAGSLRRSGGGLGAGSSGGGNVQTLVVHGDDDTGASTLREGQHAEQEQQHADPGRPRSVSRPSASASQSPLPHSSLTSIHSGHGSVATAGPLPPVLPPPGGRGPPVGSPLLAVRSNSHGSHSPMASGLASGITTAAGAPSSPLRVAEPAGLLAQGGGYTGISTAASPVPPHSSLQQPPSPGRLRPGQRLAPDTLASGPSLLHQHKNGSSGSSSANGTGLGLGAVGASSRPGVAREGASLRQPSSVPTPPKPSLAAGSCGAGSNGPVPAVLAAGTGSSALKALARSGSGGAGGGTVAASGAQGSSTRIGGPPAGTRAPSGSGTPGTSGISSRVTSGPSSVIASARALVNSTIGGGGSGGVAPSPGGSSGKASASVASSVSGLRTAVGGSTATPATTSPPTSALPGSRAAASGAPAGVVHVSPQPHPRALLGSKGSVVEQLEAEVESVKGGLAAILEKYNLRPSTPSTAGDSSGK